jgi:hypothetical protein
MKSENLNRAKNYWSNRITDPQKICGQTVAPLLKKSVVKPSRLDF